MNTQQPKPPNNPTYDLNNVIEVFSQPRVEGYYSRYENFYEKKNKKKPQQNENTKQKISMELYQINIEYCAALYPVLNIFEIALRNAIDKVMINHYSEYWFIPKNGPIDLKVENKKSEEIKLELVYPAENYNCILSQSEKTKVINSIEEIIKKKHKHNNNNKKIYLKNSRNDIMTNLSLSFWTGLLTNTKKDKNNYDEKIFKPYIKEIFPHAKSWERSHDQMQKLTEIKKLRNRVFHHNPIWYENLETYRNKIYKVIGWIEEDIIKWMKDKKIDRFNTVDEKYKKEVFPKLLKM